jgi:hypothetical protein
VEAAAGKTAGVGGGMVTCSPDFVSVHHNVATAGRIVVTAAHGMALIIAEFLAVALDGRADSRSGVIKRCKRLSPTLIRPSVRPPVRPSARPPVLAHSMRKSFSIPRG